MPDSNETVVNIDHDTKTAQVWTANRRIITIMRRLGATPLERQIGGQWWLVPCRAGSRGIIFGNARRKAGSGLRKANPERVTP